MISGRLCVCPHPHAECDRGCHDWLPHGAGNTSSDYRLSARCRDSVERARRTLHLEVDILRHRWARATPEWQRSIEGQSIATWLNRLYEADDGLQQLGDLQDGKVA